MSEASYNREQRQERKELSEGDVIADEAHLGLGVVRGEVVEMGCEEGKLGEEEEVVAEGVARAGNEVVKGVDAKSEPEDAGVCGDFDGLTDGAESGKGRRIFRGKGVRNIQGHPVVDLP